MSDDKKTVVVKAVFNARGWKKVFNPERHQKPSARVLNQQTLAGSATIDALAALNNKEVQILFGKDGTTSIESTHPIQIRPKETDQWADVPAKEPFALPRDIPHIIDLGRGLHYELRAT